VPNPQKGQSSQNSGRSRDLHHRNLRRRDRCWVLRIELSTLDPRGSRRLSELARPPGATTPTTKGQSSQQQW
jgi:hypothetical protein